MKQKFYELKLNRFDIDTSVEHILSTLYEKVKKYGVSMPSKETYIANGKELMVSKLYSMLRNATFFFLEEEYNETAWKDMIATYYTHVFPNISTRVMRVHLFDGSKESYDIHPTEATSDDDLTYHFKDESINSAYLGYFNLRPVNNPASIISFVMPNYNIDKIRKFNNTNVIMLTYERKVHLSGIAMDIKTFPFFQGESIVAVCAHCCLIMLSRYIYRKMNFNEITLKNILDLNQQIEFPSYGMTLKNILEVFSENNIFTRTYSATKSQGLAGASEKYSYDALMNIVFSMLDSRIPVIMAFRSHVILICGTTEAKDNKERYLAVYDDSGAFIQTLFDDSPFISHITWQQIVDYCQSNASSDEDYEISAIIPCYPRITLDYPSVYSLLTNDGVINLQYNHRLFFMDCNKTKEALLSIADTYNVSKKDIDNIETIKRDRKKKAKKISIYNLILLNAIIENFISNDSVHYYWWVEHKKVINRIPLYEYFVVSTVKTSALNLSQYCLNFTSYDINVISIAKRIAKELDIESEFSEWIDSDKYQNVAFPFPKSVYHLFVEKE